MPSEFIPDSGHFRLQRPFGARSLTIEMGPLSVFFEGLSDSINDYLEAKYDPFVSHDPSENRVIVSAGADRYLDLNSENTTRLEECLLAEGALLLSTEFAAYRPSDTGQGVIKINPHADLQTCATAMENYMRWILAPQIIGRGGFIMHTAGLVRDEKAYLFFGPSGSGKSTVTALSRDLPILSDDIVLVLQQNGTFYAATTPFRGEFDHPNKDKRLYPVAGVYRLRQSDQVGKRRIPLAQGIANVIASCPFLTINSNLYPELFSLVTELCRSVETGELHFRKDPSFWDAVLETVAS